MANLTAKKRDGTTLLASDAERGLDYFCPECSGVVRLRMGNERRPHFFHLEPPLSCRQAAKSLEHLSLQLHIKRVFENQGVKAHIEHRFPSVNRINDVYIPEKNLSFEIQCSPMTKEEALARIQDYRKLNIDVVWILHTMTFLKRKATSFEKAIENSPHYFSSMDSQGRGDIFDLYAPIERGFRKEMNARHPVDITAPCLGFRKGCFRKKRPFHFKGDILYLLQKRGLDPETQSKILFAEALSIRQEKSPFWTDPIKKGLFILKLYFEELLLSATSSKDFSDKERP